MSPFEGLIPCKLDHCWLLSAKAEARHLRRLGSFNTAHGLYREAQGFPGSSSLAQSPLQAPFIPMQAVPHVIAMHRSRSDVWESLKLAPAEKALRRCNCALWGTEAACHSSGKHAAMGMASTVACQYAAAAG